MSADAMAAANGALVLVDYQDRLLPAIHGAARVVAEAVRLADAARALGVPVIGTEQNPAGLGPNTAAVRERCDATLAKIRFDACADGLVERLRALRPAAPGQVVIAGCEAHVCLLQTALGLLRAGLRVFVVAPACGSRSPRDRALAMARLRQAGAVVVSTEMAIFEWTGGSDHPAFKPVLSIVKRA